MKALAMLKDQRTDIRKQYVKEKLFELRTKRSEVSLIDMMEFGNGGIFPEIDKRPQKKVGHVGPNFIKIHEKMFRETMTIPQYQWQDE